MITKVLLCLIEKRETCIILLFNCKFFYNINDSVNDFFTKLSCLVFYRDTRKYIAKYTLRVSLWP